MPDQTMDFINGDDGLAAKLNPRGNMLATQHLFEPQDIDAINAAIACRRPLLLTGDPGIGKSQLARAAASRLGCAFVSFTVDSRTESRDMLWSFDAVARLADAQLGKALSEKRAALRRALALCHYVHPGPLWWGFDWQSALDQAKGVAKRLLDDESEAETADLEPEQWDDGDPNKGCVVLIDEIDKAERSVPNGLLEALGDGCFLPEGHKNRVTVQGIPPLVVITSNQERILPDAFLRRCLVRDLVLPDTRDALIEMLVTRGRAHFADLSPDFLAAAAEKVVDDREFAQTNRIRPSPGRRSISTCCAVSINGVRMMRNVGVCSTASDPTPLPRALPRRHEALGYRPGGPAGFAGQSTGSAGRSRKRAGPGIGGAAGLRARAEAEAESGGAAARRTIHRTA